MLSAMSLSYSRMTFVELFIYYVVTQREGNYSAKMGRIDLYMTYILGYEDYIFVFWKIPILIQNKGRKLVMTKYYLNQWDKLIVTCTSLITVGMWKLTTVV